ncbi:hypothetical protein FJTKL_14915 [Diaporthe vaccinii]|uniref:CN hydrolase domain-containing protein n=1 Tax=Diaporthe vaccinii TaxID=105482 RepID=A0ABR4E6N1_9PEZI
MNPPPPPTTTAVAAVAAAAAAAAAAVGAKFTAFCRPRLPGLSLTASRCYHYRPATPRRVFLPALRTPRAASAPECVSLVPLAPSSPGLKTRGDRKKASMRIGCLQFAPQVGDVDNNLNRADAVLSKANPDDLDSLDLLVVPEMAFSGYNFTSLAHITPYLEYSGSGISSLWARTLALKHNCHVVCGYPEKVDVSDKWPTSPEYYNSAIIVSNEGETIGNYRKHFLYMIDETWALEGDGFGKDDIPGLGQTAMGICMDINPYKFEAPWHAFEFAFHVLEVRANLVILSMAWLTREDAATFTSMPNEPDMETLAYWVQRMEPLIRAETSEEIIVVFSNRCGMEDDTVYAGSSAVIGIKNGEVNVYGILSRCEKNLLVVDTDSKPIGKLVNRPDLEGETETPPGDAEVPVDPGNRVTPDETSRIV